MTNKPCPVCGKEPTATPIENSFYSYAELTEEQKIRFAAYQVFDVPKKASSKLEAAQRWIPVSERLPELDQDVFAVVEGDFVIGHFYEEWEGNVYFSVNDGDAMMVATHWMPQPPEVQE